MRPTIHMHPDFIHAETIYGMIDVGSYRFFLLSAMAVMGIGLYRVSWRFTYSVPQAMSISFGLMTIALIGARLMHVITNMSAYVKDPSQIYSFDLHGLSIFGAIILVGIVVFLVGYTKRIPLWKKTDAIVIYAGTGIVLARIGCFLGGCCFGIITRLPWGVRFPLLSDAHLHQIAHGQANVFAPLAVHPTQLYEALGTLIAMVIAVRWGSSTHFRSGDKLMIFMGLYFATRFITHFFRTYPESFTTAHVFPLMYLGISVSSLAYIFYRRDTDSPVKKTR